MYHLYVYNEVCDCFFFLFLKGILISDRNQTTAYDCVSCFSYFVHVGSLYFSRTRYSRLFGGNNSCPPHSWYPKYQYLLSRLMIQNNEIIFTRMYAIKKIYAL